jgi:hypothetical protein
MWTDPGNIPIDRRMNVKIGTEAEHFPEKVKEYISGIFVAVYIKKTSVKTCFLHKKDDGKIQQTDEGRLSLSNDDLA